MPYTKDNDKQIFEEPDLSGSYTAADYLKWKFDEYVELIRGKIFKMSPAPARLHQKISSYLGGIFFEYFKNHTCEFYIAPFDVYFKKGDENNEQIRNVVQPDVCVICDKSKLKPNGCYGPPDFIIEILSPHNAKKDIKDKLDLYEEYGVPEYWIIHYHEGVVYRNLLNKNGKYETQKPNGKGDVISPQQFPDFKVDLEDMFEWVGE